MGNIDISSSIPERSFSKWCSPINVKPPAERKRGKDVTSPKNDENPGDSRKHDHDIMPDRSKEEDRDSFQLTIEKKRNSITVSRGIRKLWFPHLEVPI